MPSLVLFDDGLNLAPLTDLRASFELRSGAWRTQQRLAAQIGQPVDALLVPATLSVLVSTRHDVPVNRLPGAELHMLINGRWLSVDARLPREPNTALVDDDGTVLAALMDVEHALAFLDGGCELPDDIDVEPTDAPMLLSRPWQIIEHLPALIADDLPRLTGPAVWLPDVARHQVVTGGQGVRLGRGASIGPMVAIDATDGPVVIDEHAQVGAMATLTGPCYIGPHAAIMPHADIRPNTSIGPWCKVGGEINSCIFQAYSNKSHAGFLGHSYVGEWVNLGAGTTTSNLKNTYGEVGVRLTPDEPAEPTGLRLLGSIFGDHVRTAIGTRLLTGSCVHTAAMIALSGHAPRCVEPFAFLTDATDERYVLEKFVLVADRMMQRRGLRVTGELTQQFARLYMAR